MIRYTCRCPEIDHLTVIDLLTECWSDNYSLLQYLPKSTYLRALTATEVVLDSRSRSDRDNTAFSNSGVGR